MKTSPPLAETIESILREREPNFLRLYLNPHVAQACLCLDRYARTTLAGSQDEDFQSFLANGVEEAVSGALKLLRCNRVPADARPMGLILDPAGRLAGWDERLTVLAKEAHDRREREAILEARARIRCRVRP